MDPIPSIHVAQTTERKAEPGRFGAAFRAAAASVADGVATSVGVAVPFVPGGMVLSAAIRGASRPATLASASTTGATNGTTSAAPGQGDLLEATRALQMEGQSFNLQYLQLQETMQRDSREFQALSNVMKVKHDSAKAAINNIH
jgi:hypothetical protein